MSIYKVSGGKSLSGTVNIQGAKNSSMKYMFFPLLCNDKFLISNVPDISSTKNLAEITRLQGCDVNWIDRNTVEIDSTNFNQPQKIPEELYFHTSGGILLSGVLVSRFGYFEVVNSAKRKDSGGDQIGRLINNSDKFLSELGIKVSYTENSSVYEKTHNKPFDITVDKRSYGLSLLYVLHALFRDGTSTIRNCCEFAEFDDNIAFLQAMGASIEVEKNIVQVNGNAKLHGINFNNMFDKHDFITFTSLALSTDSELQLNNVDYTKMKLSSLEEFQKQMGFKIEYDDSKKSAFIPKQDHKKFNPVDIVAHEFPDFVTEWQVLFSPLIAQVPGTSKVYESYFTNRMRHWEMLKNFGAEYKFFTDDRFPEDAQKNPRAVKVFGGKALHGAKIETSDVRNGAAALIAALCATSGSEIIDNAEHIKRGYEKLAERIVSIGGNVEMLENG